MSYNTGEQPDRPSSRWARVLSLPLLLVLAWVLYELTAQPALAVIAICTKFGWEDFRTSRWLVRRDPNPCRARATAWLYQAAGLWKIAIAASLMIFAYVLLTTLRLFQNKAGIAQQAAGALLAAFFGITLAALLTCGAVLLARRGRIKLWLHHGVHRARRRNAWPPPTALAGASNYAGLLLGTSLFASGVPIVFVGLLVLVENGRHPALLAALFLFPSLCMVLAWALYWLVRRHLTPRFFAANPAECWKHVPVAQASAVRQASITYISDEVAASRSASWGDVKSEAPGGG